MSYQITIKYGASKGMTWPISEEPLVIGRGEQCHVSIEDPTVSRRHCEIRMDKEQVRLVDLGSRNTPLVNGAPVEDAILRPGDEVSIGPTTFVVATIGETSKPAEADTASETTRLLDLNHATYLRRELALPKLRNLPQSVAELHALFTLSRNAAAADSLTTLVDTLEDGFRALFSPEAMWLAWHVEGEDKLVFAPLRIEGDGAAPDEAMKEAMRRRSGLLRLGRRRHGDAFTLESTMVSPLVNAGKNIGAVAIRRAPPSGIYDEDDLDRFVSAAQTLAPYIETMTQRDQLRRDFAHVQAEASPSTMLAGDSAAMMRVREQVAQAAGSRLNVLLLGETGSGKEMAARRIHETSPRASLPFVIVNCAAIPSELFESELFGHEKGAFTGAQRAKTGLLQEAHGGSIFLDEVGDLSFENQARLLRAAEVGVFYRVGGTRETRVDVRFISATNRLNGPPGRDAAFRLDLYYRLSGIEIHMPPLRERPEDIEALAEIFLGEARRHGYPVEGLTQESRRRLIEWTWPGNIRELRSSILRAAAVGREGLLKPEHLGIPVADVGNALDESHPLSLADVEKQHIARVLRHCGGNIRAAARTLQIARASLYRKISAYDIKL